jgi:hypothetical protein
MRHLLLAFAVATAVLALQAAADNGDASLALFVDT